MSSHLMIVDSFGQVVCGASAVQRSSEAILDVLLCLQKAFLDFVQT